MLIVLVGYLNRASSTATHHISTLMLHVVTVGLKEMMKAMSPSMITLKYEYCQASTNFSLAKEYMQRKTPSLQ